MNKTNTFLMPDYFPSFSCKMGACRTVCCSGWQVSISLDNYFALIGTDCSMELRRKMDCALKPVDYPDDGKYAVIQPNYFGQCPLRLEDGRCGVQAELGEDILPDICRLYPRGIRQCEDGYEICLANSCEAVPEMFMHREEPITFLKRAWQIKLPPMPSEELGSWQVRKEYIDILQDRTKSFPARLACLGELTAREVGEQTVRALLQMLETLAEHSDSIRPYAEKALAYFAKGDTMPLYCEARDHFAEAFPAWETYYEHLFVNHLFFTRYPFSERRLTKEEKNIGVLAVYALLRMLTLGYMADSESEAELADVTAAAFRLIEHTDFDRTALYLIRTYMKRNQIEELSEV